MNINTKRLIIPLLAAIVLFLGSTNCFAAEDNANKNYTFTHEQDLSKSGYSDILGGQVDINGTFVKVKIDLRQLPGELIFNNGNIEINASEYHWGMDITDKNTTYEISAAHWKLESQQKTLSILEGVQRNIWKIDSDGGSMIKGCNLEIQENSIILSGSIDDLDVSSISKIRIYTSNLNLDKSGYDKDSVLVLDNSNNSKPVYIDMKTNTKMPVSSDKIWTIKMTKEIDGNSISGNVFIAKDSEGVNKIEVGSIEKLYKNSIKVNPPKDGYEDGTYYLFIKDLKSTDDTNIKSNKRMQFTVKSEVKDIDLPYRIEFNGVSFFKDYRTYKPSEISPEKIGSYQTYDIYSLPYTGQTPNEVFIKDSYGSYVLYNFNMVAEKPNIYLYPEKAEDLSVYVNPKGKITKSIPEYNEGWKVKVDPSGKINNTYDFLFYEASINYPFTLNKGWILNKDNFNEEMDNILTSIGLNSKEKADFIEYWSKRLNWQSNRYAAYYIDSKEINEAIKLNLSKEPDSILRAYFYFVPLNDKENLEIKKPAIKEFKRNGFTVVEWGGMCSK